MTVFSATADDPSALLPRHTLVWPDTAARAALPATWQRALGLACLREGSDVDLVFRPDSRAQLDATLALLNRADLLASLTSVAA